MKLGIFFKFLAVLLVFCLLSATLISCTKRSYTEYNFDYFDTLTTIIGYASNRNAFDSVSERVLDMLERYHKLFDIYHSYAGMNNLYTLNHERGSAQSPIKVEPEIIELLEFAKDCYVKTDGYVNIAMGSILSLWHTQRTLASKNPSKAKLPDEAALVSASAHTDISKVIIDKENCTAYLADSEMTLDVGAIAKGYAVERIAKALEADGISGYVLNVGGNVRTVGSMPDGSPWPVGIENPDSNDKENAYIATLGLSGEAIVTSGTTQRYYVYNGVKYHHIIDKDTLYPAEGYLSVSIISKDSGVADALSTALFCTDVEQGREILSRFSGVEAVWVCTDGNVYYSDGFADFCS